MAHSTFSHSVDIDASPDQVWAELQQPETWEAIGGVDRVYDPLVDSAGELQGFSFETTAAGKTYQGKAEPHAREDARLIAWEIGNDEIEGTIRVELDGDSGTTRCTTVVEISPKSFLSSMFFPVIAGVIGDRLPTALEFFAAKLAQSDP